MGQAWSTLETTHGQMGGFFSQLPFKCHLPEVASVADWLKICPWVAFRVNEGWWEVNETWQVEEREKSDGVMSPATRIQ